MGLSLEGLHVLDAIERCGSFAAAAEELSRVPSALTYAVQKLEQDLGVILFDRAGHRARLTPAGAELLNEGRHLLRAAQELECRVRRVATGWETELRFAYDDIVPLAPILRVVDGFYRQFSGAVGNTRIRLAAEVLSGCWDALTSGRADLVIGAAGDVPGGSGYTVRALAAPEFVFAVAPGHPLADAAEPVATSEVLPHRAAAIADNARNLPPRTVALLGRQDVFTLPNVAAKLAAQIAGLGIGYLPVYLAAPAIADGRLIAKRVSTAPPNVPLYVAWRSEQPGKALKWFVKQLLEAEFAATLFDAAPYTAAAAPAARPVTQARRRAEGASDRP